MTLEQFKQEEWYKSRPDVIKQAIEKLPPTQSYMYGCRKCELYSYEEPESGKLEDVTVTVQFSTHRVFGIGLDKLRPLTKEDEEEIN